MYRLIRLRAHIRFFSSVCLHFDKSPFFFCMYDSSLLHVLQKTFAVFHPGSWIRQDKTHFFIGRTHTCRLSATKYSSSLGNNCCGSCVPVYIEGCDSQARSCSGTSRHYTWHGASHVSQVRLGARGIQDSKREIHKNQTPRTVPHTPSRHSRYANQPKP